MTGGTRAWGRDRRPAEGALLAAALVLAVAGGAGAEMVNRIVATIDGDPITLIELQTFADQARRRADDGAPAPADQRALLEELVLQKIMKKQVDAQGLTATDAQIDAYITSIRERNQLSDEQLKAALAERGLGWEEYRAQVRADIERANLINKEIRGKVNVSPEEVQRYYEGHLDEYGTPARLRVRLISLLLDDGSAEAREARRARAEEIRAQAAKGKDFAALAREHSEGPGAAEGGDIGEVASGSMQDEFEQAVANLKAGQVSPVIETETGFHILKVEERAGESHLALDEVGEAIREKLYREAIEQRYDRWLKQDLRSRHHIEILL